MKVICLKNHLKEAINLCEKITGKNLSLPILSNILISNENNRILRFTATNLELGIEVEIPAKVEKKGRVAVPGGVINNFLANFLVEENITFESQNNNLLISSLNSSTLIKGQSPEDFPILPKIKTDNQVLIPVADFVSGLKAVWYASSLSNIKPEIASIYLFSSKNEPLTFAATDSFRLAEKKINYSFPNLGSLLIPFRTAAEILRIFEGREGKIKLISDKNQISLELDNIKFIFRPTEGVFPDYQQIIPKKFVTDAIVDKNIFINSLKTAGIFSSKLNELNIIVGPDSNSVAIKTSNADVGEHTAQIPAKITGEELKMGFNHKYIFECLGHISSQKILLRFSGQGKPLLITGADDNSFQYLVMPMNTM
ncbi:MAG: DNA polymerase III subunit beta [Candidatus Terrybacteria bacterium]|nr:DNA polymerase III subunit beta [Candidatus Terrybacteria bacterium]